MEIQTRGSFELAAATKQAASFVPVLCSMQCLECGHGSPHSHMARFLQTKNSLSVKVIIIVREKHFFATRPVTLHFPLVRLVAFDC